MPAGSRKAFQSVDSSVLSSRHCPVMVSETGRPLHWIPLDSSSYSLGGRLRPESQTNVLRAIAAVSLDGAGQDAGIQHSENEVLGDGVRVLGVGGDGLTALEVLGDQTLRALVGIYPRVPDAVLDDDDVRAFFAGGEAQVIANLDLEVGVLHPVEKLVQQAFRATIGAVHIGTDQHGLTGHEG